MESARRPERSKSLKPGAWRLGLLPMILVMTACQKERRTSCSSEALRVGAGAALESGRDYAAHDPRLLKALGLRTTAELARALAVDGCCRVDQIQLDGGPLEWSAQMHAQGPAGPLEITVQLDLCGVPRSIAWSPQRHEAVDGAVPRGAPSVAAEP